MIYAIGFILLQSWPSTCAGQTGLAALFAPVHPVLGRYEVCVDSDPIERIVAALRAPGASGAAGPEYHIGDPDFSDPLEALGGAGDYDRGRVARLYGGSRPKVARGWRQAADRFESIALVSPYPEPALDRLNPGTLVIRWIIQEHP
jgi:hypothetical protein